MTTEAEVYNALKYWVDVDARGTRRYRNAAGRLHREDGPAVEFSNGNREWWQNGQLHREDGPAIERLNGYKAWWLHGRRLCIKR